MKLFQFLKSTSGAVHEEQPQPERKTEGGVCTSLTVWRKSLIMSCNGFTVIDSTGNLAYRVDNYSGRPVEVTLMDASGKPILTMRRPKNSRRLLSICHKLVDSWLVYEGEADDHCRRSESSKKPICSMKKHMNILPANPSVLAYVFRGNSDKSYSYVLEGSYAHRSCKVLDDSRRVVAEIKRKEASKGGVSFGLEVFVLVVQPGFDTGFAMALVLLLDQMFA